MKIPIKHNGNKFIDSIMVAALLWAAFTIHAPAASVPKSDSILPVCIGVTVVIIGGVVIYKLADFCNRKFPKTNTARIVFQGSTDMSNWVTELDTNCYWQDFEYRAAPDGHCKFHRVMFP